MARMALVIGYDPGEADQGDANVSENDYDLGCDHDDPCRFPRSMDLPNRHWKPYKIMTADTSTGDELASQLLSPLTHLMRSLRYRRPVGESLKKSQFMAIAMLDKYGPMSPGDLARRQGVQPSAITGVIFRLEMQGLIRRGPIAGDRRRLVIELTSAGNALFASERPSGDQWLSDLLETFTAEDRRLLWAVLPVLDRLGE